MSFQVEDAFAHKSMTDWTLVTHGAERHGSWEWVACRRGPDLDRYIGLALTSTDAPGELDENEPWVVEVWGGADDGRRYTRVLVHRVTVARPLAMAAALSWLEPAKQRVSALGSGDLTDAYAVQREPSPSSSADDDARS